METILKEAKGQVSRQAAILEAAFELFSQNGFSATRLDDVARRAGVAKGTLYLYFSSKEEMFKKVVEQMLTLNLQPLEEQLGKHTGPVLPLLEQVFRFVGENMALGRVGHLPRIIIAEAANFPDLATFYVENVIARVQGFFAKLIQMGIDRGEFKPVEPVATARILMAPFLMLALVHNIDAFRRGLKLDPKAHVEAARFVLMEGLKKGESK